VKIDIHSHLIPESYFDALRTPENPYGARIEHGAALHAPNLDAVVMSSGAPYELAPEIRDPEAKIRELDRLGFDLAVVSPGLTVVHYELVGEEMRAHIRRVNDGLAEVQRAHRDRLRVMGLLPMQDPEAAVEEVDRLVDDLDIGAAVICTNIAGANLDEPRFRPVFARIADRGVFLFIHAWFVAAPERLTRYHLINAIGNPFDVTIAIGSVIFSGILDTYPTLKLCFAHSGGAAPYIIGRMDRAYTIRPEAGDAIPSQPSSYIDRLYFDTIIHNDRALQYLVDTVGSDRVLAGTDCPFHKTDMGDPTPFARIASLSVGAAEKRKIEGLNAAAALGL
jgi:aminocarboxymuconate-semialdehyde decarboxylase